MFRLLLALLAAISAPQLAVLHGEDLRGTWRNPSATVDVSISNCGMSLCGTVIRASAVAEADAREAGYPRLVSLRLMRDFRPSVSRHWHGTILVPDMGHEFSSHIVLVDSDHALVAGCLFGRFLCKSQLWHRL
jgi:uncharacterized protein (DUF2147 family)